MDIKSLKLAQWSYRKGIAQLSHNHTALITIKFSGRSGEVSIENRTMQIRKSGFWRTEITILERGDVLLSQRQTGIWGYKHEVQIGNRSYSVKSKASLHYRVLYTNSQGKEVLSYFLNAWKWKPPVEFQFDETAAPASDIPLLMMAGYLTLRKLKQDSDGVAVIGVTG